MNETISLQELFSILRKSFWRILALTIVAASSHLPSVAF